VPAKIREDIEGKLAPVAGYGLLVSLGMILVMFYAFRMTR
jgi:hypothetical protein